MTAPAAPAPGRPEDPDLRAAYAEAEDLARGHAENFPVLSWATGRRMRPHVAALYAFCRRTDDLGDEAPGDRVAALDAWEADLRRCFDPGGPPPLDATLRALARTVAETGLPIEPFLRLVEANRLDQRARRYADFAALRRYCALSADPVGRLYLRLHGVDDPACDALSDDVCTGLQLANHLQDLAVDLAVRDRVYLPADEMAAFAVDERDLRAGRASASVRALVRHQVARAARLLAASEPLAARLPGVRLRLSVRMFAGGGLAVLAAIAARGHDPFHRPVLGTAARVGLAARAVLALARAPRGAVR